MPSSRFFNKVKLHTLILFRDFISSAEHELVGKYVIKLESPKETVIPKIFKKSELVYNNILKNNKPLSRENINKISEDIAKIHWYLSQATPFARGSAGIADAFCKALFEFKGIQVSPYKKNLDPNMEAYVLSYNDYIKKYKDFFTEPPRPIK